MEFRRQPLPVTISIEGGELIDREEMLRKLMACAGNAGDNVDRIGSPYHTWMFRVYPRAVND